MGYEAKKIYRLKFADEDMEGLEVRITSPSVAEFFEIAKLADLDLTQVKAEDLDKIRPIFELFIKCLKSWNAENDGEPVPQTLQGLMSQDLMFILKVVDAWMNTVANVPAPLVQPSKSGEQYPEALIPMETLSQSQAS